METDAAKTNLPGRYASGRTGRLAGAFLAGLCAAVLAACSGAPAPDEARDDAASDAAQQSAAGGGNPLRNAYFGDLHVHTSWSLDAWTFGHPMQNDPSVAYRYGRGEPILDPDGTSADSSPRRSTSWR